MLQWENDLTSYQEQSVTATFEVLFAELDEDSSRFLKLLSFLDPERIPLKILIEGAKVLSQLDELPTTSSRPTHISLEWSGPIADDPVIDTSNSSCMPPDFRQLLALILSPIQRKAAVQKLQRLSLVEHLSDHDLSHLRIHDLVHYMIGERAKKEDTYGDWLRSAVSLVCRAFGSVEDPSLPRWWPECEMFMPHLHSLTERWSNVHGVNLTLAKADVQIVRYLNSRGRYGEAEAVCKRSLESCEKECGTDHPDMLAVGAELAITYNWQGRYADAQAAGERILAVRQQTLGADHTSTLDSMNTLAFAYFHQRRLSKAEGLLQGVLTGFEKNLGLDHRYTLSVMENLALVYLEQGRVGGAEHLFRSSLAGKVRNFDPDDVGTLATVHNLARICVLQKRYDEAEELYKRSLLAKEQHIGFTHPDTLITIYNLGHLYRLQGRYNEAEEYFKRALTGQMQQLGASHPHTSETAWSLAELYRSQGRGGEGDAVLNSLRDG
jgi:tetratricopeptide (TPR) repeat protein